MLCFVSENPGRNIEFATTVSIVDGTGVGGKGDSRRFMLLLIWNDTYTQNIQ